MISSKVAFNHISMPKLDEKKLEEKIPFHEQDFSQKYSRSIVTKQSNSNSLKTLQVSGKNFSLGSLARTKPVILNFKDPAVKPFCDKSASFEKNYNLLPGSRLNLVVNKKMLENDQSALDRITRRLEEEAAEENLRKREKVEFRRGLLTAAEKRKKKILDLEAKTGLKKINSIMKITHLQRDERLDYLSTPKSIKQGYAEDYIDSFGLLKAGLLENCRSTIPKSARSPGFSTYNPFSVQEYSLKHQLSQKIRNIKSVGNDDVYSRKEIRECMSQINEFHNRYGELKGRVGFPQIDLEKYKRGENN